MKKSDNYINTYNIYILINPITNNVFYVGQTINLTMREYVHLTDGGLYKRKEIAAILKKGQKPIMKVIEVIKTMCYCDTLYVTSREYYWIKYYKSIGSNILNRYGIKDNSRCKKYEQYISAVKNNTFNEEYYIQTRGDNITYCLERIISDGFTPSQKEKLTAVIKNIGVELQKLSL